MVRNLGLLEATDVRVLLLCWGLRRDLPGTGLRSVSVSVGDAISPWVSLGDGCVGPSGPYPST